MEGLNPQLVSGTLLEIQAQQNLWADLNATLLGFCDDLEEWDVDGYQIASDAGQIKPGNWVLYMYMDEATAEWCVKEHCLPYKQQIFWSVGHLIAAISHTGELPCNIQWAQHPQRWQPNDRLWRAFLQYTLCCLATKRAFRESWQFDIEGGYRLEFDVFARPRQANDLGAKCFKYDIISAGKCLFSNREQIEDVAHIGKMTDFFEANLFE